MIFRCVERKVVESWAVWDRLGALQKLDAAALAAQVWPSAPVEEPR